MVAGVIYWAAWRILWPKVFGYELVPRKETLSDGTVITLVCQTYALIIGLSLPREMFSSRIGGFAGGLRETKRSNHNSSIIRLIACWLQCCILLYIFNQSALERCVRVQALGCFALYDERLEDILCWNLVACVSGHFRVLPLQVVILVLILCFGLDVQFRLNSPLPDLTVNCGRLVQKISGKC